MPNPSTPETRGGTIRRKKFWIFRRHLSRGIILTVKINGQTVIGPITSEDMYYISKFGGTVPYNILDEMTIYDTDSPVEIFVEPTIKEI